MILGKICLEIPCGASSCRVETSWLVDGCCYFFIYLFFSLAGAFQTEYVLGPLQFI